MGTAQLVTLTTTQLVGLTTVQLSSLSTSDLNALTTSQFAAMTTNQISHLTTAQFAALETADLVAMTTSQFASLTTAEIVAFTTAQIVALETADVYAFSTAQVAAFEAADTAAMSTSQMNALIAQTPIVLDLDGNGIQTTSAANGVNFDLGATGTAHQVGWVGGKDGLLVMDRNGDGIINDGRELFGAATQLANGQRAGNGYAAMEAEDTNHDGKLNAQDKNFDKLRVWVDANHDGKTDAGELRGLVEAGVLELDLSHVTGHQVDNGNVLGLVGGYTGTDGARHDMADVWFTQHRDAQAPALGELLAGPPAALIADSASGPAAHQPSRIDVAPPPMHRASMDEDWRNTPLV